MDEYKCARNSWGAKWDRRLSRKRFYRKIHIEKFVRCIYVLWLHTKSLWKYHHLAGTPRGLSVNINFGQLRKDVESALDSVGQKYDIQLRMGRVSYNATSFTAKLEGATIIGGVAETPERSAFKIYAHNAGLHPGLLGFEFTDDSGRQLQIVGWNTRAKRMPVKLRSLDGGSNVKASVEWLIEQVSDALERLNQGLSI